MTLEVQLGHAATKDWQRMTWMGRVGAWSEFNLCGLVGIVGCGWWLVGCSGLFWLLFDSLLRWLLVSVASVFCINWEASPACSPPAAGFRDRSSPPSG